jgi:hypothetical protein
MKPQLGLLIILTATVPALGTPYWIAWEGDDFPENQGWTRNWGNYQGQYQGDGAIRTLEDGILTYDSLFDVGVCDFSFIEMPGQLDPDPGEVLVMEWRLKVDELVGWSQYDPGVAVKSDEAWVMGLGFAVDQVLSVFEHGVSAPITPGVFHSYVLRSPDMRTYELFIDGELALEGVFVPRAMSSYVGWGDSVQGAASLHHWDYFRFGVVAPEPGSILLVGALLVCCGRRRA